MHSPTSIEERFWAKVDKKPEGCWLWTASRDSCGYGHFWFRGRLVQAHRVSYQLSVGEIPADRCLLHSCDVRECVNPEHLRIGTPADNAHDRSERGRYGVPAAPRADNDSGVLGVCRFRNGWLAHFTRGKKRLQKYCNSFAVAVAQRKEWERLYS